MSLLYHVRTLTSNVSELTQKEFADQSSTAVALIFFWSLGVPTRCWELDVPVAWAGGIGLDTILFYWELNLCRNYIYSLDLPTFHNFALQKKTGELFFHLIFVNVLHLMAGKQKQHLYLFIQTHFDRWSSHDDAIKRAKQRCPGPGQDKWELD